MPSSGSCSGLATNTTTSPSTSYTLLAESGCISDQFHLLPCRSAVSGPARWPCPWMAATVPNRPWDRAHDGPGPLIFFVRVGGGAGAALFAPGPGADCRVWGLLLGGRRALGEE